MVEQGMNKWRHFIRFNFNVLLRYLANLRYTTCIRAEENFCAIKWNAKQFQFGIPSIQTNQSHHDVGFSSGFHCNSDDFIGIDQASQEGTGPGEDRFCGSKLLQQNNVICE